MSKNPGTDPAWDRLQPATAQQWPNVLSWTYVPANAKHLPNVVIMLDHRLRHWPNINTTLVSGPLFAAVLLCKLYTVVQRQKAVSAHFTSKQILPFAFARQYYGSHLGPPAIHIHFYSNLFIDLVSCHLICSLLSCISPSSWVTGLSIPRTLSQTIPRPKWPLCQLLIVMVFCEKKSNKMDWCTLSSVNTLGNCW